MKTAYFICGPESMGNRLWARILIQAGCYGDGDTIQRLDHELGVEDLPEKIVWIRSFPHGPQGSREWPDMSWMRADVKQAGYRKIFVLVPQRDMFCAAMSQLNAGHIINLEEGYANIQEALIRVGNGLTIAKLRGVPVVYEHLVKWKGEYINRVLNFIELPQIEFEEEIYDGNEKYYVNGGLE